MTTFLPARAPFSFEQTLTFLRRFAPAHDACAPGDGALVVALADRGRAVALDVRAAPGGIVVAGADADTLERLAPRVSTWLGLGDDLGPFYRAAAQDPVVAPIVEELWGLHHVAFHSLAEIALYAVLMQRTPMPVAVALKRRFLARFGWSVVARGQALRVVPELDALAALPEDAWVDVLGPARGARACGVVRGVAALGEEALRSAPYEAARSALLAIPGVGPFSACALLLRGLGRMDALPDRRFLDAEGEALSAAWDGARVAARYGRHVGYLAFYLKTAVARRARPAATGRRERPASLQDASFR